jgi:hypothetical protein
MLVSAALGIVAGSGVLWLTQAPGPGLEPDSMSYLGAAESLARDGTLAVPFADWSDEESTSRLSHFPPGYPFAIALGMMAGASASGSARVVQSAAAVVSAGGAVMVTSMAGGPLAGTLAGLAVLATPAYAEDHVVVLSEPLFLALLVLVLGLMVADRPRPVALGIAGAAALLVRYAGVAVSCAAALWCFARPGTARQRVARAALVAGPATAAFLFWSQWAGEVREYGWLGGNLPASLAEGWGTLQGWLAPAVPPSALCAVLALGAFVCVTFLLLRGGWSEAGTAAPATRRLVRACTLLAICYGGVVFLSRLFADGGIPFDNRIGSPVFVLVTIAAIAASAAEWRSWPSLARGAAAAAGVLWLAGSILLVEREVGSLLEDGWGYASPDWTGSSLGVWLRTEGMGYMLYSDNPAAVYSLAHRSSRLTPEDSDPATLAAFGAALAARPSAIIGFANPITTDIPRAGALAKGLRLRQALRSDDGSVWVR